MVIPFSSRRVGAEEQSLPLYSVSEYVLFSGQRGFMLLHNANRLLAPANRRWSRWRERSICPRRHLRVLPIRTRPSLFASD